MKDISAFAKIYLAKDPVDFRKQANGLLVIVKESLGLQPFDGKCLFVFTNRSKTSIRLLYWDMTGFALWSKVLEKDKFIWPTVSDDCKVSIGPKDLRWLLQGADLTKINIHKPLTFEEIHQVEPRRVLLFIASSKQVS
jgi:transposase